VRSRSLLTARRTVLAGVVADGGLALGPGPATAHRAAGKLRKADHIVVVYYQENRSFDNLYGGSQDVDRLSSADPAHTTQVNQAGAPLGCLKQNDRTSRRRR
jgi:phospholipase C